MGKVDEILAKVDEVLDEHKKQLHEADRHIPPFLGHWKSPEGLKRAKAK